MFFSLYPYGTSLSAEPWVLYKCRVHDHIVFEPYVFHRQMQVKIDVAIAEQCGVKFYQTPAFAAITLQDVNKLAIVEIKNVKTGQMRYENENPAKFRE